MDRTVVDTAAGSPLSYSESPPETIGVVVADDHPLVREALAELLASEPAIELLCTAGDLDGTFAAVAEHRPDVLVLDAAMPDSVLPALPDLLASSNATKVLVVTGNESWRTARDALALGALGYQLKTAHSRDLVQAVRTVARGGRYLHPEIGAMLSQHSGLPDGLTEREAEVLRLLAAGCTNREIGRQVHLSVRTVESYRARIRLKTGCSSRAELVRYAGDHGIV